MSKSEHGGVPARRDPPGPPPATPPASPPAVPPASQARRLPTDEADAILRRAARSEQSAYVPAKHDLTVAELMEVAREVGFDPLAVRRSASIENVAGSGAFAATVGAPDRREIRATMHGGLPDDRHALARAAEKVLARSGKILEDESDRFVWRESHGVGRTTVTISGEGGRDVSIVADRAGHYLVHWFLGLLAWAALSSVAPFSLGPLATTLLLLITPVLLARPFWTRSDRAAREKLDELAMELLRVADEATADE